MFQYAAGRFLSERHGVDLKLDTTYLSEEAQKRAREKGNLPREFELGALQVRGQVATEREINRLVGKTKNPSLLDRVEFRMRRLIRGERRYRAPRFGFDPEFQDLPDDIHLSGRFAHHRYFEAIKDKLRCELAPRSVSPATAALIEEVSSRNSIGIHVRRGDYVFDTTFSFIGAQPLSYYEKAYYRIAADHQDRFDVYVFSDDIAWCEENLKLGTATRFVSGSVPISAHEELEIMKQCRNLINSNSTFSWWAAWLMASDEGVVVAPSVWYRDPPIGAGECCPDNWHTA